MTAGEVIRVAPGALRLASSGNASSPHIAAELFAQAIDVVFDPYAAVVDDAHAL